MRQAETRYANQAVDVRLDLRLFVCFGRLPERVAAEAEAGVVDEDVQSAELADRDLDEPLAALPVGDVELELDLGFQLLDATGAAGNADALSRKGGCGRGADAARGAGDDRGLSLEARHNRPHTN